MKRKIKYTANLPRSIYTFFISYSDPGAPSFEKFARSIGVTLEDIEHFRRHSEFDRAFRECNEIRRDYLIDGALAKRLDSSFTKYLLELEFGDSTDGGENEITLRVIE